MPCDTVNTVEVEFGEADPALLKAAMATLYPGLAYTLDKAGKLTTYGNVDGVAVKKEMSKQTAIKQFTRFGWSVKEQPDGKLLVQKARL